MNIFNTPPLYQSAGMGYDTQTGEIFLVSNLINMPKFTFMNGM